MSDGKTTVFYKGKLQSVKEWSEELNIPVNTIWWRIRQGWTAEQVLRVDNRESRKTLAKAIYYFIVLYKEGNNGLSPSRKEISKELNLAETTVTEYLILLKRLNLIKYDSSHRGIKIPGGKWIRPEVNNLDKRLDEWIIPKKEEE